MATFAHRATRQSTAAIILLTTISAIVVNLAIYGVATQAGASFDFTDKGTSYHVYAYTLIMFTAVPLLVGLTLVAILSHWIEWVYPLAMVIAPLAAVVTIFVMTIPADLDAGSTIALALGHVVVGIAAWTGIQALRTQQPRSAFRIA